MMNTFTTRDYQLDTEYRTRKMSEVNEVNLASHLPRTGDSKFTRIHISRLMLFALVITSLVILLLVTPPSVDAQVLSRAESDSSVSAPVQHALIMGAYFYSHERYEEAIEQFEIAIEQMPPELFEIMPEQSIVFWQLGEALEQAGYLNQALDCYEQYLELAGEDATDKAVAYVTGLQGSVGGIKA